MKFFVFVICVVSASNCHGAEFKIKNNSGNKIRIGIQGGNGHPHLENGGFELDGNQERIVQSPEEWEGRFWAATGCDNDHCDTGYCGKVECGGNGGTPPATLVEIKLKGDGGQDYYDISLVDGFNVKASIAPNGGSGDCPNLGCNGDVNEGCPDGLKLDVSGTTVGCKSSCIAYDTDLYCCRGPNDTKETCNINDWEVKSAQYFKSRCQDAYSYAYDDSTSLKTCASTSYTITFG